MRKLIVSFILLPLLFVSCTYNGAVYPNATYQGFRVGQYTSSVVDYSILAAVYAVTIDSICAEEAGEYSKVDFSGNDGNFRRPGGEMQITYHDEYEGINALTHFDAFIVRCIDEDQFRVIAIYPGVEETYQTKDSVVIDLSIKQGYGEYDEYIYYDVADVKGCGVFEYEDANYTGRISFEITAPLTASSYIYVSSDNSRGYNAPATRSASPPELDCMHYLFSDKLTFMSGGVMMNIQNGQGESRDVRMQYKKGGYCMIWFNDESAEWHLYDGI